MTKQIRHTVSEQHLIYIGDITVSFALLEIIIQDLIGSFIAEHQKIGQIITAELSFRNLIALVISLYIERHGKDDDYLILDILPEILNEQQKNNKVRNIVYAMSKKDKTIVNKGTNRYSKWKKV